MSVPYILNSIRTSGYWGQMAGKLKQSVSSGGTRSSQGSSRSISSQESGQTHYDFSNQSLSSRSGSSGTMSRDSLDLSFDAEIPAFNEVEKNIIQQEMAQCKYGLGWQWLDRKNKIGLQRKNETLRFTGYHARTKPGTRGSIIGDCEQLTHQLGERLTRKFKGKYQFNVVRGNYPQSPWRVHYFLVAWPAKANAYFVKKSIGRLEPFTQKPRTLIPKEAFIIDPTYQLMGCVAENEKLYHYYAIHPFQEIKDNLQGSREILLRFSDSDNMTRGFPLGFARDLKPDHSDPDEVGFAYFKRQDSNSQNQTVTLQFKWGNTLQDWQKTVPPGSDLHTMLTRLQQATRQNPSAFGSIGSFNCFSFQNKPC